MKTFTQVAFVRVEDPEQRKELIDWLNYIGRPYRKIVPLSVYPCIVVYSTWHDNVSKDSHAIYQNEFPEIIDCGTNTAMFCALAAIREDSDYRQWFVTPGGCWRICSCRSWSDDRTLSAVWHKATPDEIVEHFKD